MSSLYEMADIFEDLAVATDAAIRVFEADGCSTKEFHIAASLREEASGLRKQAERFRQGCFDTGSTAPEANAQPKPRKRTPKESRPRYRRSTVARNSRKPA